MRRRGGAGAALVGLVAAPVDDHTGAASLSAPPELKRLLQSPEAPSARPMTSPNILAIFFPLFLRFFTMMHQNRKPEPERASEAATMDHADEGSGNKTRRNFPLGLH